ncbi:hypothetical protein [Agromyces bauzanensis]|uniref:Uncharacterized protein n=1 Tax=Agromyces bauzanensis TaxID=1308924 RepID=A0A917PMT7_9MICO|nr:hypothetical protein [Agromyces bauzanensis]GGJ84400.1 hypothetical protein GCM10011372_23360 [Agromyces bauzanensis]
MTTDAPPPELHVDSPLAARLAAAQHPDLAGPIELVANAMIRLGDRYAIRLPRRRLAIPLARNEQRWLPVLAPRLTVPIPSPRARRHARAPDAPANSFGSMGAEALEQVPAD